MSEEKERLVSSILFPAIFVIIIWFVKLVETLFHLELHIWGIFPKQLFGLRGVVLSPLIHGDFAHLASNSLPLLVLGSALFYFYRPVAFRVFLLSWLITGLWVWVMARPSYHIGASGIIYSLAAFLFASGIIRKHPRLIALSLLVVFLYGSMVWGIFPIKERISWESHLMGMICGFLLAYFFRHYGPQRITYSWEENDEDDEDDEELETGAANSEESQQHPYYKEYTTYTEGNVSSQKPEKQRGNDLVIKYTLVKKPPRKSTDS